VVAIHPARTPLFDVLGEQVGEVMAEVHRDHGVETILEDAVVAFEGSGRVERVVTKGGRRIACDFAVVGVGIEPVTGSALDIPAEPATGCQCLLARFARLGPLCGSGATGTKFTFQAA